MNGSKKKLSTWEEVMVNFFRKKSEVDEEKNIKETIKSLEASYIEKNFFGNEEVELVFNTKKNKKAENESSLDFQYRRAIALLKAENKPEGVNAFQILKAYKKEVKAIADKYNPTNWLSKNCSNASSVSFATHVIKLTHSSIDASSLYDSISDQKNSFLTTSTLKDKTIDGAVKGNQFAPIFQFLELECNGAKLAERLAKDDHVFDYFADDTVSREEIERWISGFRNALTTKKISSHALAKQVFFPTNYNQELEKQDYHILCNVISSSMAQAIQESIFDERNKPIQKSVEKNKYSGNVNPKYINRSHLGVTASNHSNASQLNAKRGGKLHLFSARPPTWQSQITPPIYKKSLFSEMHNSAILTEIDYLRDFLIRFKQLGISIKDPKRKRHLDRWVNNIIDEVLFYTGTIQNLPPGWTNNEQIKLKKSHQYLLDPYRIEGEFQSERQNKDWHAICCTDFSHWLNYLLRGKDKQFTPQAEHTRLWKKMLEQPLREYMEPVEESIKQRMREVI